MNTDNLLTVKEFADKYPSKKGIGVSPAYIYKLIDNNTPEAIGFKLVKIAGRHFIEPIKK